MIQVRQQTTLFVLLGDYSQYLNETPSLTDGPPQSNTSSIKPLIVSSVSEDTLSHLTTSTPGGPAESGLAWPGSALIGAGDFSLSVKMVPVSHMTFGPTSARSELWT